MNVLLAQAVFVRSSAPSPGPPLAFFAFLGCIVLFFFALWVGIVYMPCRPSTGACRRDKSGCC